MPRPGPRAIDADALDALAEGEILAYLTDPANVDQLADADVGDALAAAHDEVAAVTAERDALADRLGRGELSAELAARAEAGIQDRLREAERRVEEITTPSALRGLVGPGEDVEARWDAAPISARREVARLLLAPGLIGQLRLTRSPVRGHPVPRPSASSGTRPSARTGRGIGDRHVERLGHLAPLRPGQPLVAPPAQLGGAGAPSRSSGIMSRWSCMWARTAARSGMRSWLADHRRLEALVRPSLMRA